MSQTHSQRSVVYEIAILGRLTINAHSLNNEGTVGNVVEPRTVSLADGTPTDGISGEMLKHLHAEAYWAVASAKENFCTNCKKLDPGKASGSQSVMEIISALKKIEKNKRSKKTGENEGDEAQGKSDTANQELKDLDKNLVKELREQGVNRVLSEALKCPLCNAHGFLIEEYALSRKSTIEFGWALALPNTLSRDVHTHTRVAPGEKRKEVDTEGVGAAQAIYNRPTRSGIYAFLSVFQPWRIGLHDVSLQYIGSSDLRRQIYDWTLEAYKAMFVRLEGAMTTTRLPHVTGCKGLVVHTAGHFPVPIVSPLADNYYESIEELKVKAKIPIIIEEFNSLADLLGVLDELKNSEPAKIV